MSKSAVTSMAYGQAAAGLSPLVAAVAPNLEDIQEIKLDSIIFLKNAPASEP